MRLGFTWPDGGLRTGIPHRVLDDTVKLPDVLKHTGAVVIGTIRVQQKEGLNMLDANVVVTHCDPKSPYRSIQLLRTNIQYSGVDKPMKPSL